MAASMAAFLAEYGIQYVSRPRWGARPPRHTVPLTTFSTFVTHHSAGGYPTSPSAEIAEVQWIQTYHMDNKGWSDIAYNFLVAPSGNVYEGRGIARVGGGTGEPYDQRGWSVCALGYYHPPHNHTPTPALQQSFSALWTYFTTLGGTRQLDDRDANDTVCPGDRIAPLTPWPISSPTDEPDEDDMTPEQEQKLNSTLTKLDQLFARLGRLEADVGRIKTEVVGGEPGRQLREIDTVTLDKVKDIEAKLTSIEAKLS